MAVRQIVLAFVITSTVFIPAATAAVTLGPVVPVRVYDAAGLDARAMAAALATARATLTAAAEVSWTGCAAELCGVPPEQGEFVLRLVTSTAGAAAGRRPPTLRSSIGLPLGDAFVDLATRSGVLATIYVDRVALLAEVARVDMALLLGRAIAHEIGHLLLASNVHGRRGLMRPVWSADELRRARENDWTFSREEIAAIRRRLEAGRMAMAGTRYF